MTNPLEPALFAVAVKIGYKNPEDSKKEIERKEFVFSGFEDRDLANRFEEQISSSLRKFILENAQTHSVIKEHLWFVRPVHCETEEEINASKDIPLDPSEKFESILEKILQSFRISQEAPV